MLWLLLFVLVSVLALQPQPQGPPSSGSDKIDHLLAFAALGAVGAWALCGRGLRGLALGLCAYGGLIELLQMHIPGRGAEWGDWGADTLGVLLGWAVYRVAEAALRRT